ncbi:MAG: hypothetical protein ACMV0Y_00210 [Paludibacter sp.]
MKPFYIRCKALSTVVDTPLRLLQCAVNSFQVAVAGFLHIYMARNRLFARVKVGSIPATIGTCLLSGSISFSSFLSLHRLQIPSGKWRYPFATLAKPFRLD